MANHSIFFTLPLELRTEIYRELLAGLHKISTPSPADGFSVLDFCDFSEMNLQYPRPIEETAWADRKQEEDVEEFEDEWPKPDFTILRVSRQIYNEASEILYGDSLFVAYYRISQLNSLKYPQFGDLGAMTANLPRVRKLVIGLREDLYKVNQTAKGIKEILQFYANNTKMLRYLQINLRFGPDLTPGGSNTTVSTLLEDPEMAQVLNSFALRDELAIQVTPDETSSIAKFEEWALSNAEHRDWVIYKHDDKDSESSYMSLNGAYTTSWFVVPKGRMPLEAGCFTAPDMRHLPVSGRIVDFTRDPILWPMNDTTYFSN